MTKDIILIIMVKQFYLDFRMRVAFACLKIILPKIIIVYSQSTNFAYNLTKFENTEN